MWEDEPMHVLARGRLALSRGQSQTGTLPEANVASTCQVIVRAIKRSLTTLIRIEPPSQGRLGSQSLPPSAGAASSAKDLGDMRWSVFLFLSSGM